MGRAGFRARPPALAENGRAGSAGKGLTEAWRTTGFTLNPFSSTQRNRIFLVPVRGAVFLFIPFALLSCPV